MAVLSCPSGSYTVEISGGIPDYAFYNCDALTSVTIPDSVTSIGNGPFAACSSLREILVSSGNKNFASESGVLFSIDFRTLKQFPAGSSITSYRVPDSVTSIGAYAFWLCSSLSSVTIGENVT